jgi:hypothetical protein
VLQPAQTFLRKNDMPFLMRPRQLGFQKQPVLPACEIDDLPGVFQLGWQIADRLAGIDDDGEQLLVERASQRVFLQAPARRKPICGNEKNHGLAARRGLVQRPLPSFAGRDAAIGPVKANEYRPFSASNLAERRGDL